MLFWCPLMCDSGGACSLKTLTGSFLSSSTGILNDSTFWTFPAPFCASTPLIRSPPCLFFSSSRHSFLKHHHMPSSMFSESALALSALRYVWSLPASILCACSTSLLFWPIATLLLLLRNTRTYVFRCEVGVHLSDRWNRTSATPNHSSPFHRSPRFSTPA